MDDRKTIITIASTHPFYRWYRKFGKAYALGRAWHYWYGEDCQLAFEYIPLRAAVQAARGEGE